MRRTLFLAFAVAAMAGCGGDDEAAPTASAPSTAPTAPATGTCRDVDQPAPKRAGTRRAPTALLATKATYRAVFQTSCGSFTVKLDQKASPRAVASFVTLARARFFDGTFFHRIVPGFVIQGGDPTGSGMGGPGYSTVDTPSPSTTYKKGTVAMAKAGTEPPGTAGSQFFVVTGADANLPPDYAVIGHVVGGREVVERIGLLGDPNTEQPTQPVVLERVRIQGP